MDVGIIGLGRMGIGMGGRLALRNHTVRAYDVSPGKKDAAAKAGIVWMPSPLDVVNALAPPRVVIVMVPAGTPTEEAIQSVEPALEAADVLIDGGNSYYKDSMDRAERLKKRGIRFLDAGISGGVWGFKKGFCIMVGGDSEAFGVAEPLIRDLAPENGYAHVGESGAGHYAKMIHNGIEYGMLQAYGEGFELLEKSDFDFDLAGLAHLWNHGSVIRSWLLELAGLAFEESPDLADIRGYVEDSGEGRWTVREAIDLDVPAPVITLSLMSRFRSRQEDSFSAKVIAALRQQFGGHSVKAK